MEPIVLARKIVDILEDKIAENILLLDLKGISDFTDYFVLASGTSDRMLSSLSDVVAEKIKADGLGQAISEGTSASGWMVLDYGSVVVHLLSPEKREYYQLEELWNKGKIILHLQ
ncbi:MAG: ribosome silencing factor [Anaerolineaceae bacterium]